MPEPTQTQKKRSNTNSVDIFFLADKRASDNTLRRTFLNRSEKINISDVVRLESLGGVAAILPIPGARMFEAFNKLIGANNKASETEMFVCYVAAVCSSSQNGSLEKNGLKITPIQIKGDSYVMALHSANEMGDWESVGKIAIRAPFVNHVRTAMMTKKVRDASKDIYSDASGELYKFLSKMHLIISNVEGLDPGGELAENDVYKDLVLLRSHGNQNLVVNHPTDPGKMIKMVLGAHQGIKTDLEVLANKVIEGAGFNSVKSKILTDKDTGVKFIEMDNYRAKNGITEVRQEYFLDFVGKPREQAHNMNYQEMAKNLDIYEGRLPEELRDSARLEQNKKEIFKWALVNSATNNTDNHGRNLGVLVDDRGRIEVTPFFDVGFDGQDRPMSTHIDGIPPVHHIDLADDSALVALWGQLGIDGSHDEALSFRNDLAQSMQRVPEYAQSLDMDVFASMDYVIRSVGIQSPGVATLVSASVEEARNRVIDNKISARRDAGVSI